VIFPSPSQNDALEQISRGFREYSRSQMSLAAALGAILVLGLAGILLYVLLAGRERFLGRRMFYRLARASGLAKAEAALLVTVSRRVLPDNPPAIFVRRSLFESAVSAMSADAALVQSVRKKVYGA
jgi:hypothetical protein